MHVQRSSCDEISFCHDVHAGLQDVSSPTEASAATLTPSVAGVSLKATHTAEEPHIQGDGGSTAVTLQTTPKAADPLFLFSFLACSLPHIDTAIVVGSFSCQSCGLKPSSSPPKVTQIYCHSFFYFGTKPCRTLLPKIKINKYIDIFE